MKTLTRFNKSLISTVSAAALVVGGGLWQVAIAGEMFSGTSTICAIAPVEPEIKRNGFVYTDGAVLYYRIATEPEHLMNGPVTLTSYSKVKTTPDGKEKGWYWGEIIMAPDQVPEVGTLEETFKFKAKDAGDISGTFYGTGELEGVTVEYTETYNPLVPQEYCTEYPPCVEAMTCIPVSEATGLPPYVTEFEGVVFGY